MALSAARHRTDWTGSALAAALVLVLAAVVAHHLQDRSQLQAKARLMTGGDPAAGEAVIEASGCGGCHEIPGVPGAEGKVGPSLEGVSGRAVIAGKLANTPANLIGWVSSPQSVVPGNAMPDMGLSGRKARDVAAYLYTLR